MYITDIAHAIINKWSVMSELEKEKVYTMTEKSLLLFVIDRLEAVENKIDTLSEEMRRMK